MENAAGTAVAGGFGVLCETNELGWGRAPLSVSGPGVELKVLAGRCDRYHRTCPKLVFGISATLAEFERQLISEAPLPGSVHPPRRKDSRRADKLLRGWPGTPQHHLGQPVQARLQLSFDVPDLGHPPGRMFVSVESSLRVDGEQRELMTLSVRGAPVDDFATAALRFLDGAHNPLGAGLLGTHAGEHARDLGGDGMSALADPPVTGLTRQLPPALSPSAFTGDQPEPARPVTIEVPGTQRWSCPWFVQYIEAELNTLCALQEEWDGRPRQAHQ